MSGGSNLEAKSRGFGLATEHWQETDFVITWVPRAGHMEELGIQWATYSHKTSSLAAWILTSDICLSLSDTCNCISQQGGFVHLRDVGHNNSQSMNPTAITGYLSGIEQLSGANFKKWKEQIGIVLGCMDLDYALREPTPTKPTSESTNEQKALYEKWERSNRMSLMIMKGSITPAIRGAIPIQIMQ
ncbi:hypothetical protein CK203_050908 [Vitis vinifera]|uniref:Uncharacterized protein n=1 Tax=Vitis vinifera TaxID=29760 RepID=A0A438GQV2_VITVI|nr:hypothetical protein CK203_050908 [Vitis vinifera]